jgi:hypothetical protein
MEPLGRRDGSHHDTPSEIASPRAERLDPVSRASLQSFAIQFAIVTAVALGLGGRTPLGLFIVLSAMVGQFNAIAALLSGQRWGRGPLSRWDTAMMLFAVSLAARFFH